MSDTYNKSNKKGRFKGLEHFNIENLFCSNDGSKPHTNGELDVETLFDMKYNDCNSKPDVKIDTTILLHELKKQKIKLDNLHNELLKKCWDNIISANKHGLTNLTYEVPLTIPTYINYDPYECIKFIKEKLDKEKIYTKIKSFTKIYISWSELEKQL